MPCGYVTSDCFIITLFFLNFNLSLYTTQEFFCFNVCLTCHRGVDSFGFHAMKFLPGWSNLIKNSTNGLLRPWPFLWIPISPHLNKDFLSYAPYINTSHKNNSKKLLDLLQNEANSTNDSQGYFVLVSVTNAMRTSENNSHLWVWGGKRLTWHHWISSALTLKHHLVRISMYIRSSM